MSRKSKEAIAKIKAGIRALYRRNPLATQRDILADEDIPLTSMGGAHKYKKIVDSEMLSEMISSSKEDDMVDYLKVLQYLHERAIELIDNSRSDMAKATAMKVASGLYEKFIKMKVDLGIHKVAATEINLNIKPSETAALDKVFGGLKSNVRSLEKFKKALGEARKNEGKKIKIKAPETATAKKIRERLGSK